MSEEFKHYGYSTAVYTKGNRAYYWCSIFVFEEGGDSFVANPVANSVAVKGWTLSDGKLRVADKALVFSHQQRHENYLAALDRGKREEGWIYSGGKSARMVTLGTAVAEIAAIAPPMLFQKLELAAWENLNICFDAYPMDDVTPLEGPLPAKPPLPETVLLDPFEKLPSFVGSW